jgi:hypothetical protein
MRCGSGYLVRVDVGARCQQKQHGRALALERGKVQRDTALTGAGIHIGCAAD